MTHQQEFDVTTRARTSIEITSEVANAVRASGIKTGLAQVFTLHTSCGLAIMENADPAVRHDLETLMQRWAPDGDPEYSHALEGRDDMAAHARTLITGVSVSVPVTDGKLRLGTWQGIYLFEHRTQSFRRRIVVTVLG